MKPIWPYLVTPAAVIVLAFWSLKAAVALVVVDVLWSLLVRGPIHRRTQRRCLEGEADPLPERKVDLNCTVKRPPDI